MSAEPAEQIESTIHPGESSVQTEAMWRKWASGCSIMVLVGFTLAAIIAFSFGHESRDKTKNQAIAQARDAVHRMIKVRKAILDFNKKKGFYPLELSDLVPEHISDSSTFEISTTRGPKKMLYNRPNGELPAGYRLLSMDVSPPVDFADAGLWTVSLAFEGYMGGNVYTYNKNRQEIEVDGGDLAK